MSKAQQAEQIKFANGFIAALDQSGGSTPKALALYGIKEDAYSNDAQMYDLIHEMRSRIATAPAFTGEKVLGAILFERTMDGVIEGQPTASFLWEKRGVVPFLKIDKGLDEPQNDVRLLKPMPDLDALLTRAVEAGIFGTKMRSVIDGANPAGIKAVVEQQFEVAAQILSHGLTPIVEPEVTITIADKSEAENILLAELKAHLDAMPEGQQVILKLTLPEVDNQYAALVAHPAVMRVVALSGGYSREEANARLSRNTGIIASFSRALTEGLNAQQSDEEFNSTIAQTIDNIYAASVAG